MKNKLTVLGAIVAIVLSMELLSSARRKADSPKLNPSSTLSADVIAGPGQIEPISEDIKLGSELAGKLKSVNVEEGDSVHSGEIVAVLENRDYEAELLSATAEVQAKEAMLRKIENGARTQERAEALASSREAQAVLANAQTQVERRQELYQSGIVSREELEHYTREYNVAKEQCEEKSSHYLLVNDAARQEDLDFAQADLQLAKAKQAEAQAKYEKTFIKSPIEGVVLRKHHRNGESISNSATTPDPVLTIGDARVLRVRVDVDESDVNKVRLGEKAYVTADAFGQRRFWGRVVQVGELLGPKTIRTDEPAERVDRKFLETLVELEPGASLPMGLRVDTFILTDEKAGTSGSAQQKSGS